MKYFSKIAVLSLGVMALSACGTVASKSGGLADEAYIQLSSTKHYRGSEVLISIDQAEPIPVKVSRDGNEVTRKGLRLAVTPGRHQVVIRDKQGRKLYERQIFVSTRNSKNIVLP